MIKKEVLSVCLGVSYCCVLESPKSPHSHQWCMAGTWMDSGNKVIAQDDFPTSGPAGLVESQGQGEKRWGGVYVPD
jgi:hypothetical protein